MTKSELIEELSNRLDHHRLPKKDVEAIVDTVFNMITDALVNDQRVEIRGFGSFSVRRRDAKEARNPKTGESVSVPRKIVPFWKAGKELSDRVDSAYLKQLEKSQNESPSFSVGD